MFLFTRITPVYAAAIVLSGLFALTLLCGACFLAFATPNGQLQMAKREIMEQNFTAAHTRLALTFILIEPPWRHEDTLTNPEREQLAQAHFLYARASHLQERGCTDDVSTHIALAIEYDPTKQLYQQYWKACKH